MHYSCLNATDDHKKEREGERQKESYQAVALFGSGAATGAEQVAALARFGAETSSLVTLRAAVDLGELLAVLGALAPAAGLARRVTRRTLALRLSEVVDVDVLGAGPRDDLVPVDRLHVAQVVVVEKAATARQNI